MKSLNKFAALEEPQSGRAASCESDTSQACVRGNGVLAFFCDCGTSSNRREERGFCSRNGPHHDVGCSKGGDSRHHRRYHGIPAGFFHRAHVAGATLLRPRRGRFLGELHHPDSARRDPCDPPRLLPQAAGDRERIDERSQGAALRALRARRLPASRDHRRLRAFLHQGRAVQPVDRLHHAGVGRAGAARRRRDEVQEHAQGT